MTGALTGDRTGKTQEEAAATWALTPDRGGSWDSGAVDARVRAASQPLVPVGPLVTSLVGLASPSKTLKEGARPSPGHTLQPWWLGVG